MYYSSFGILGGDDLNVTDVFDRADQLMYEDKRKLKKHK